MVQVTVDLHFPGCAAIFQVEIQSGSVLQVVNSRYHALVIGVYDCDSRVVFRALVLVLDFTREVSLLLVGRALLLK